MKQNIQQDLVLKAFKIAQEIHKNQKRNNGFSYIVHPVSVSEHMTNDKLKIIALLHDTIEDGNIDENYLIKNDIPKIIVEKIMILTKKQNENYFNFIIRILNSNDKDCILVKLADLHDNMKDLKEGTKKDKYRFAKYILENKLYGGKLK